MTSFINDRGKVPATGNVAGPASATDNAATRFDGTTGKLLQNSVVIIGDTGVVTGVSTLSAATTIGVGGATPSASGAGISFPATQSASTDANTLDDYEEGTWTPNVGADATYTAQTGTYTKIGRLVTAGWVLVINLINTGASTYIQGLPFNPGDYFGGQVWYYVGLATNVYSIGAYSIPSTSRVGFTSQTALDGTATLDPVVLQNGTELDGSITYSV